MDEETAELEQIIREEDEKQGAGSAFPHNWRDVPQDRTPNDQPSLSQEELVQIRAEVLSMNQRALSKFQPGAELQESFSLLKKSESLLLTHMIKGGFKEKILCELLVITLNNIACYYKKRSFYRASLRYFAQILTIEKFHLRDPTGLPYTYMNISTILSHVGKLREACRFARRALALFQELVAKDDQTMLEAAVSSNQKFQEAEKPINNPEPKPEEEQESKNDGIAVFPEQKQVQQQLSNVSDKQPVNPTRTKELNCFVAGYVNLGALLYKLGNYSQTLQTAREGLAHAEILGFAKKHDLVARLEELVSLSQTKMSKFTEKKRSHPSVISAKYHSRSAAEVPLPVPKSSNNFSSTQQTNPGNTKPESKSMQIPQNNKGFNITRSNGLYGLYTRPRSVESAAAKHSSRSKDRSASGFDGYMEAKNAFCAEMPIGSRTSGVLIAIDKVKGEVSVASQPPVRKVPRVNIEDIYVRNVMHKNKALAPKEGPHLFKDFPLQAKLQMLKKTAELRQPDQKRLQTRYRLKPRQPEQNPKHRATEGNLTVNPRGEQFRAKSLQASAAGKYSHEDWNFDREGFAPDSQADLLLFGEAESFREKSRSASWVDELPQNPYGLARIEEQSEEGAKSKSRVEPMSGSNSPLYKRDSKKQK